MKTVTKKPEAIQIGLQSPGLLAKNCSQSYRNLGRAPNPLILKESLKEGLAQFVGALFNYVTYELPHVPLIPGSCSPWGYPGRRTKANSSIHFQRILTFSWVKALGPHKHMPNSLPMFAALIELTRLPGAGYRLHDWSTYPLLLTYSQRKQFYKIIRVLSLPQCNLPLHVPSAFPMTSHASSVEQHHLPKAILTCFCLNTLMPSSGRSFGKKKKSIHVTRYV